MANDLNQCNFIGRLGKDPETRYLPNGDAVTNFSIACGETWKDKQTQQKQEKTEWINIVAWRKLGEICGEYLRKGSQVMISGKFTTEKWKDQSGNDRYSTKIVANNMQMLGNRDDNSNGADPAPKYQQQAPGQQQAPQQSMEQQAGHGQNSAPSPASSEFEDDIPF